MKRLFISYAQQDRDFVEKLAAALGSTGFDVWWDRELEGGQAFRSVIEENLNAADAVVVVWSGRSRVSRFVLDEAEKGLARDVLVPVRMDRSPIPLGFGGVHALDFAAWTGALDAPSFAQLNNRLAKVTATPPSVRRRRAFFSLAWGLLLGIVVGLGFAVLAIARDLAYGSVTQGSVETAALLGVGSAVPVALWAAMRARRFAQSNPFAVLVRMARTYAIAAFLAILLVAAVSALSDQTIEGATRHERFAEMAGVALVGTLIFGAAIAVFNAVTFLIVCSQRAR
jgi:hypothetical protein